MSQVSSLDPRALIAQAFPTLPQESVGAVAALATVSTYPAGTTLCRQGAVEHTFYLVSAGRAEVVQPLGEAGERVLRVIGPGEYFGELAIITDAPRAATVRTVEPTTVVELDRDAFTRMLGQNPSIGLTIMRTVLEWLRANEQRDITDLEAKTDQVEAAYDELARREAQRGAFLSAVATGLLDPLKAAQQQLEALKRQPVGAVDQAELEQGIDALQRSVDAIIQQVNDLLFVQSLEPIRTNWRPVAVGTLLRSLVDARRAAAAEKRLQIAAAIAPDLPHVEGDEEGLARAFCALLDNAVNVSRQGAVILVTARRHRDGIELAFVDSGGGIPDAVRARLFEPFGPASEAADGAPAVTGLGLAVARYWVEHHGGAIDARSQAGQGTTFTIRLPTTGDAVRDLRMPTNPTDLLKQVFPGLEDEAAGALLRPARIKTYPPHAVLCEEGAHEDVFYIVAKGRVEVAKRFARGEARVLREFGPGDFFGEMSIVQSATRSASVRTIEETTVIEIDKEVFEHALRRSPSMAMTLVRATVDRLRVNDQLSVAELKRKTGEVEAAYHALTEHERLLSEFLTTLAHELRTPLTSAKGFMQLIQRGMVDGPALRMALDRVTENIEHVVALANDLLFLQEIELIRPALRPVAVGEIVQDVVGGQIRRATESGLGLVTQIEPGLPEVQADPEGLARAFRALLDNAIKFSPDGGQISITVRRAGRAVEIAFTDPGVGIPPAFIQDGLFTRFERYEGVEGRLFGGVGLGLPIARHIIEEHGGISGLRARSARGAPSRSACPCRPPEWGASVFPDLGNHEQRDDACRQACGDEGGVPGVADYAGVEKAVHAQVHGQGDEQRREHGLEQGGLTQPAALGQVIAGVARQEGECGPDHLRDGEEHDVAQGGEVWRADDCAQRQEHQHAQDRRQEGEDTTQRHGPPPHW
ncbi:MAG: cyclic nucleotide-binding domain-containing protein [Anaerolineae bacterium]|nr:cyclic nucleotide-binding domain-containing protein [Anaerolineae bacterium]